MCVYVLSRFRDHRATSGLPAGGIADAEIKTPWAGENPELKNVLPLKPGAGQIIATHASPTARILFLVLISICPVHSPSFYFLTASVLAIAISRALWLYEIGQPAHGHNLLMQVPVVSAFRNINRYQNMYYWHRWGVFSVNCNSKLVI